MSPASQSLKTLITYPNWHRMMLPERSAQMKASKTTGTESFTAFNTVLQRTETSPLNVIICNNFHNWTGGLVMLWDSTPYTDSSETLRGWQTWQGQKTLKAEWLAKSEMYNTTDSPQHNETIVTALCPSVSVLRLGVTVFCIQPLPRVTLGITIKEVKLTSLGSALNAH